MGTSKYIIVSEPLTLVGIGRMEHVVNDSKRVLYMLNKAHKYVHWEYNVTNSIRSDECLWIKVYIKSMPSNSHDISVRQGDQI